MKSIIIIPARYHSTRFPGKPLVQLAGKTMLARVFDIDIKATEGLNDSKVLIATDDERIMDHAKAIGAEAVMTPESCRTGSDRVLAACLSLDEQPNIIVNLQGDAPLTPPSFVRAILNLLKTDPETDVATPIVRLSWKELDELREQKKKTPFSGTTVTINTNYQALWFSKQIIPAIRNEPQLRLQTELSPVYRHIGLYGYRLSALQRFVNLPEGCNESLEGLEQLRFLENGMSIKTALVDYQDLPRLSGVDTLSDAKKTEELLLEQQ